MGATGPTGRYYPHIAIEWGSDLAFVIDVNASVADLSEYKIWWPPKSKALNWIFPMLSSSDVGWWNKIFSSFCVEDAVEENHRSQPEESCSGCRSRSEINPPI
ncbi:hypothetical protein GW17_00059279 [Ensete ventricosum]|nr:hypothetical protein GW17_00059279 [Ensete ventricosum]